MEAGGIAALSGCMAAEGRSELCAEAGTSELPPARLGLTGTGQRDPPRAPATARPLTAALRPFQKVPPALPARHGGRSAPPAALTQPSRPSGAPSQLNP